MRVRVAKSLATWSFFFSKFVCHSNNKKPRSAWLDFCAGNSLVSDKEIISMPWRHHDHRGCAYLRSGIYFTSNVIYFHDKVFYHNLYSCQSLLILFCNEFIHPLIPFDVTESDLLLIFLVAWKRSCGTAYEILYWNLKWKLTLRFMFIHACKIKWMLLCVLTDARNDLIRLTPVCYNGLLALAHKVRVWQVHP